MEKKNISSEKEKRIYRNIFAIVSAMVFVLAMTAFGVVSFLDEDATVSESENRKLKERPPFSLSALLNGGWTQEFENYYSDTFPFREMFINLNSKISGVLTQFGGKDDNVIINYDKEDSDFVGEGIELGVESTTTKTPEKDTPKNDKEDVEGTFKGSILVTGKMALEIFTGSDKMINDYSDLVNATYAAMPENVKFYSMLVPTASEFYSGKTYSEGIHSQKKYIDRTYEKMSDGIIKIDVYSKLEDKTKEYIYFRTDHHWTARGAHLGYEAFCDVSGNIPVKLDELETGKIDDFVGSLYKTSNAEVLKKNPDFVEYFKTRVDVKATVYADAKMQNGQSVFVVARKVNSTNKYLAFIGGDQPLEKIVTSNKNGKKILVIKESYGNALVPFLCDNYEEIYVVDPRKTTFDLTKFVEEQNIDEVLMINYSFAMANSTFSNALYKMIK